METIKLNPEQFPPLLREIYKPPKFLQCAGALPPQENYKYLCVIGARRFSKYGLEACRKLISGLRDYPIVIVSGLAIGIDSIAHQAALDSGIKTIAFPGSGLSETALYPARHFELAQKIVQTGNTLLSPFSNNQLATSWTFPVRNRLMAGSSHATLIIEGRQGSGTLLTADYALEFNRDIFIVPGSIFSELSYGPHMLFRRGAIPVTSSEEILEELGFEIGYKQNFQKTKKLAGMKKPPEPVTLPMTLLSKKEKMIINVLQFSPLSGSELIEKTSFQVSELNILLSELELKNLIVQEDNYYRLQRQMTT